MFPYYCLFFIITIFYFFDKGFQVLPTEHKRNFFSIFLFVLLSCFLGLRDWHVGVDTLQYAYRYNIVDYTASLGLQNSEFGFFKFMFFIRYCLGLDFQCFMLLCGIINIFALIYNLHRYSVNIYVGIVIYLTIGLFTMNLSGMRQSLALSICFLAIPLIENRKFIFYLILIGVAFTIHNSAIIFLPIYFLWGRRLTRFQGLVLLVIILLAFIYRLYLNPIIEFLAPIRYAKIDLFSNYNINILVILLPICLTIFSLIFLPIDLEKKFSKADSFFYAFSCFYVGMLILSINNNQIGRLCYYFSLGNMICFPKALKNLYKYNHVSAIVLEICSVLLLFLYFFISTPGGTLKIDNYHLFFM